MEKSDDNLQYGLNCQIGSDFSQVRDPLEKGTQDFQLKNNEDLFQSINISSDEDEQRAKVSQQQAKNDQLFSIIRKKYSEAQIVQEIKKCLICGAEINAQNPQRKTILHIAVKKNYEDVVQFLLEQGIRIDIFDKNRQTALDLARDLDNVVIIQMLENYNRQGTSEDLKQETKQALKRHNTWNNDERQLKILKLEENLNQTKMPSEGTKFTEHGNIFQLKLLMLCLWRAGHTKENGQRKYEQFRLATEMPNAEKFDDVVFQYKEEHSGIWKFRLVQAKHRENENPSEPLEKIKLQDLLSIKDDEAFSLQKYFHSYLKIQQRCKENSVYSVFSDTEIEDVIVITNTDFDSEKERSIFENPEGIEVDALLKTNRANKIVYTIKDTTNNKTINELKIVFENCSNFSKLTKALAYHISSKKQIEKNNIFKEYYYPLVKEILKIDVINVKSTNTEQKEKKYFVNLDNFIKKQSVNGQELSDEARAIRCALIKDVVFRKGTIKLPEIDESFGDSKLPNNDEELNNLAIKVAEFIKENKEFTVDAVDEFRVYHIALAQKVVNIKNGKLSSKLVKVPIKTKIDELLTLSKFKRYLIEALDRQTAQKKTKEIEEYLENINIDISKIHENFGIIQMSSDQTKLKELAKKLGEFIKENKKFSAEDFRDSHVVLANQVIDTKTQKFHEIFINGEKKGNNKDVKVLNPETAKLRRLLLDEIEKQGIKITIKMSDDENQEMTIKELDADAVSLKKLLNSGQIQASKGFWESSKLKDNTQIQNTDLFAKQMKDLINTIQDKEQRVIEINDGMKTKLNIGNDAGFKTFNDNIKKLAGYVLINRFNKIRFSTAFLNLKSDTLPGDIRDFRAKFKKLLGVNQFEFLYEYEFKFDKPFSTCEDGELYRKLPLVHTDKDVNAFFSKLKFIVNYPNRKEINDLLGADIKDKFKTLDSEVFQSSYYEHLHSWMSDRVGSFYTPDKTERLFKQIQDHLSLWTIDGFNKPYFADSSHEYKFEKFDILDTFLLSSNQKFLQLICQDLFLGRTRVVQAFKELQSVDDVLIQQYTRGFGYIFLYLSQLKDQNFRTKLYEILKKYTSKFNLVVIECNVKQQEIIEKEVTALYDDLSQVMELGNKKFIFITTHGSIALAKKTASNLNLEFLDSTSFNDLTEVSQQKLLGEGVVLQGQKICLNKLIDASDKKTKETIDVETLVKLMKGEEIIIGSAVKELGEVSDYYIARKVSRQVNLWKEKVKEDLKKSSCDSDVFVICGADSELKSNNNVYVFDNTTLAEDKFEELCELHKQNTGTNIHWLEIDSEKLTWYKSQGSISNLIQYKVKETKTLDATDNTRSTALVNILKDNRKIVIISATAGMGKSIALTRLAMELKTDPSLWVIRINLNDHTTALYNRKYLKFKEVVNFLLDDINVSASQKRVSFQNKLFENIFNTNGKIALLFDGFDEISPDYKDTVIVLLQSLTKSKVEKLFVTTRPSMCESLEREFGVFSYVLNGFSPEEQIEFLIRFWTKKLEIKNVDQKYIERLKKYAQSIIEQISKSIFDKKQSFIAIPLQTKMVAEVFQEDQALIESKWQSCKNFLESENDKPELPKEFALLDLYEHFIERKFYEYYLKEKKGRDFTKVNEIDDANESYQIFKKNYALLALHTLFDDKKLNKLLSTEEIETLKSIIEKVKNGKSNEGIAQITDGSIHFIHRTFAEYLASFLIAKKMLTIRSVTLRCIENVVLNTSPVFINNIIEQLNGKMKSIDPLLKFIITPNDSNTDLIYSNFIKSLILFGNNDWVKKLDASGKTPLHYAIDSNNSKIVEKLLNCANDIGTINILKHSSFVEPKYENSKVVKFINIQDKSGKTALFYTIQNKNLDLAFELLLQGASIESLSNSDVQLLINKMLRPCLNEDLSDPLRIYNGSILTAYANDDNKYRPTEEKLFLKAPDIFKKLSKKDQSRILSYFFVHGRIECIKALLGTIDDAAEQTKILKRCDNSYTPLDRVNISEQLNDDERLAITKYLLANGGDKANYDIRYSYVASKNRRCSNYITKILQAAAREGHIKTFEYFIGQEDPKYYHIHLRTATECNQYNIINCLSTNYKKSAELDCGNTALHTACDSGAALKIIKYLIDNGELINDTNDCGETPLFMAMYNRSDLRVIEYLVTKGADFNHEDNSQRTPLFYAIKNDQVDIIKYLVRKDARISENSPEFELMKDTYLFWKNPNQYDLNRVQDGLPRLHSAIKSKKFEFAKFLVRRGSDVNKIDTHGKTPLHWAAELQQVDMVEFLLQYGVLFNKKDNSNSTPRDLLSTSSARCNKIVWLLDVLDKLFNSQNLMQDLDDQLLNNRSGGGLNDWGPYRKGHADVWDGDNPMLFILNGRNMQGKSLLHIAASTGDSQAMCTLFKWNGDYLKKRELHSKTHPRCKDYQSTSIDTRDSEGNTPLHLAAQKGYYRIVSLLLEKGAIFNSKNVRGDTPGVLAEVNQLHEIVNLLQLTRSAFIATKEDDKLAVRNCIDKAYVSAKNEDGKTLLHLAAASDSLDIVQLLLDSDKFNIEVINVNKNTPLHDAVANDKIGSVILLLKYGAIYNAKNNQDQRPLDLAHGQSLGLLKEIDTLFENIQSDNPQVNINNIENIHKNYKIDVSTIINTRDDKMNTLLHYAAKLNDFNIVKVLLENGAIFNAGNKWRQTPIEQTCDKDIRTLLNMIENIFNNVDQLSTGLKIVSIRIVTNVIKIDDHPYCCLHNPNNPYNLMKITYIKSVPTLVKVQEKLN